MTNEDIVELLELTAKLMELHNQDPNKVKSYATAAYYLDKYNERPFAEMTEAELLQLKGVGRSIAGKILELVNSGTFPELSELLEKTPEGVLEMFRIKGVGVKKVQVLWRELGIDSIHELEQACERGDVAKLKGFGQNIQAKILEAIAFLKSQKGKLRMNKADHLANELREKLLVHFDQVEISGEVRRGSETVSRIELLVGADSPVEVQRKLAEEPMLAKDEKNSSPFIWRGSLTGASVALEIRVVPPDRLVSELFLDSAVPEHLQRRTSQGSTLYHVASRQAFADEKSIYEQAGLPYIVPEMREGLVEWDWSENHQPEELITWDDLRGILHNHTTYSDGRNTLKEMADYCRDLGFEYLGVADHSQSAGYANGLNIDRVYQQQTEIDFLNEQYKAEAGDRKPFRILKGIESDILGDGSLDYPDEVLASFDYVVASVHSNLTMSIDKAMERLLKAIANPYTTILGHPTGRLLLSRAGYPVDHKVLIDACAEHNVIIEINASPWRLDLDWRWISYCMEKGVMLSINPDAHEIAGYHDMHYGVRVGRKGGLTRNFTFNALSLEEVQAWIGKKKGLQKVES